MSAIGYIPPIGERDLDKIIRSIRNAHEILAIRREVLTANREYFVRMDGSDTNDGLTNSPIGAFRTIQKAVDAVSTIDLGASNVVVRVADGTYTNPTVLKAFVGSGTVTIAGNASIPSNCLISVTGTHCFHANGEMTWIIQGFKLQAATAGSCVVAQRQARVNLANIEFGNVPGTGHYHMWSDGGSFVQVISNYAITGGASGHILATWGGRIAIVGRAVTVSGAPSFNVAFANAVRLGQIDANANSYSGTATGKRYNVDTNAVIFTDGAGANYFPGDAAGTFTAGGVYA